MKHRLRALADQGGLGPDGPRRIDSLLAKLERTVKAPTVQSRPVERDRYLAEREYRTILADRRVTQRQRLFVEFLYLTGCRVSELCEIRREHCSVRGTTIIIRVRGKGAKERLVRIPLDLYRRINDVFAGRNLFFETSGGRRYQRQYVSAQVAAVTERVLGRRLSAHALRHGFATRHVARNRDLAAVSRYLGHSSVSVTGDLYVHTQLSDAELFDVAPLPAATS